MAMRAPLEIVPEAIHEAVDNPGATGRALLTVIRGGLEWGAAEEAGEAVGGAAAIAVAASGVGDIIALVVIIIVLAVVILGTFMHHFLRGAFGKIPFGAGGPLQAVTDIAFGPFDALATWCAHTLQQLAGSAMHGFATAVHWAIQQGGNVAGGTVGALIYEQVHPVKAEVDHLWVWVNDINRWVTDLSHHVGGAVSDVSAYPATIAGQLHTLQRDVANLTEYAHAVDGRVHDLSGQVSQLHALYDTLAAHTAGVRAVNVGWQDIATTVTGLSAEVQHLAATVEPRIIDLEGRVLLLTPLGLLLDAGAVGLRNLRKLEDDICQCPRLPNVGGVLADILALKHELKGD